MSLRDVIRSLFPGVTDEHLQRVCDELAPRVRASSVDWAGGMAPGDDPSPRRGTLSAEGVGLAPSAAPSTGVEPSTDRQIAELIDCRVEFHWAGGEAIGPLIARIRQEQASARDHRGAFHSISAEAVVYRHERDEARRERDAAVARAEKAEREHDAAVRAHIRAEAQVARMQPVVEAALEYAAFWGTTDGGSHVTLRLNAAVATYRAAEAEADQ